MKVIDKIGPDGCVYVVDVSVTDINGDVIPMNTGANLRAIFNHKGYKEIGDPLTNKELSEGARCIWVKQVYTKKGEFVYEHTDKEGVRRNVLITHSHLLPTKRHKITFDLSDMSIGSYKHTDKYKQMMKEVQKLWMEQSIIVTNPLQQKMEKYPLPDEYKF